MAATDGVLPTDAVGYRSGSVYVPNVGTVAQQGSLTGVDSTGQPYGSAVMTQIAGANGIGSLTSFYPANATAITASSGNVAAGVATATLAAVAGKTTWITGFAITGAGATAGLAVAVTVTNVITGTMTYIYVAATGVAVANTPLVISFPSSIPASAVNTTIVVSCPSLGAGNTNNAVVAYGYQV